MKDAIPTPAERLDIRRRQERVDPNVGQSSNWLNKHELKLSEDLP